MVHSGIHQRYFCKTPVDLLDSNVWGYGSFIFLLSLIMNNGKSSSRIPKIIYIVQTLFFFLFFKFYFIFKLYIIVLVLPNIKMNPPQVYMCSPSRTLLPPPSPFITLYNRHFNEVTHGWKKYPFILIFFIIHLIVHCSNMLQFGKHVHIHLTYNPHHV